MKLESLTIRRLWSFFLALTLFSGLALYLHLVPVLDLVLTYTVFGALSAALMLLALDIISRFFEENSDKRESLSRYIRNLIPGVAAGLIVLVLDDLVVGENVNSFSYWVALGPVFLLGAFFFVVGAYVYTWVEEYERKGRSEGIAR